MQFLQHDLGHRNSGEIVEVTITSAANVRLMDSSNFQSFRSGRRHTGYGGHATRSPVRLPIPRSGRWYVVVDLGGYSGRIGSSVRVLPGALPQIREAPLSSVPSLLLHPHDNPPPSNDEKEVREYDVFISHASDDKEEIVRPLAV